MIRYLSLAVLLSGCFDSLVSDPCQSGFAYRGGSCVASDGPDAGGPDGSDAHPPVDASDGGITVVPPDTLLADALVCTLPEVICSGTCTDITSDPDNCGACGHVCASGICTASHCVGEPYGHIIAIGHDYTSYHPAMARVLGNAVALGHSHDIAVAFYRGSAGQSSTAGTTNAIASSLATMGRPWHTISLTDNPSLTSVDAFVVDAQTGDGTLAQAAGAQWKPALDGLLARGGVVIVLEGNTGVSYRFATGAGLYTIAGPVDATNQLGLVVDPSDAVADQVVSPYLAETTSVTLAGAPSSVVATPTGGTVVFHATR